MKENLSKLIKSPHDLASLPHGTPVLVALSGGADSTLLCHLLSELGAREKFPLYAAHVNHNIRLEGGEAARDEQFCRELCNSLSIPLFVASVDVPALARESKRGIEEQARLVRYEFFARVMRENNIPILATAHNADDNLETQIFNLCRGCGIEGICGIPEVRGLKGVDGGLTVRPMLSLPKSEVIALCREHGYEFVTDSTNSVPDYTRNAIRNRIVPELERLFSSPQRSAARLSASAREDNDRLTREAEEFLASGELIRVKALSDMHPSVAKRVLRLLFSRVSSCSLESVHTEALLDLARSRDNALLSLPDGKRARIDGGILSFEEDSGRDEVKASTPFSIPLKIGCTATPDGRYLILAGERVGEESYTDEKENIYKLYTSAYLKNVKIEELRAESRREGDRIRQGNMSKRVKKLLCDNKIDAIERDLIPIVRREDETLYVPACAVADTVRASVTDAELVITIYKITN